MTTNTDLNSFVVDVRRKVRALEESGELISRSPGDWKNRASTLMDGGAAPATVAAALFMSIGPAPTAS